MKDIRKLINLNKNNSTRYIILSDKWNEDLFFAKHVEKLGYNMAPRYIAYSFCREQLCKDIEDRSDDVPFALHSAWYYYNKQTSSKWLERA
jgi:hypothetical protein